MTTTDTTAAASRPAPGTPERYTEPTRHIADYVTPTHFLVLDKVTGGTVLVPRAGWEEK